MARHYRELIAWQKAMDLAALAYGVARSLPAEERFGLITQMQRAAVSVAANIAEGHERKSANEYRRFLSIASASLAELETHLLLAQRIGYVGAETVRQPLELAGEVGKIIRGIERAVHRGPVGDVRDQARARRCIGGRDLREVRGQPRIALARR